MGATKTLRIGELAAEFGLNPKTIRYYEEIGLLPHPERTEVGYRLYSDSDRDQLRFITKAKAIGLTLTEIAEILAVRKQGDQPCDQVVELLDRKVAAVDRELRLLADFRRELVTLREEAAENRAGEACVCGIIEHHNTAFPDRPFLPRP
ncbi:MAG: heavy metal-responsive transcriptional regulator [bacterium]